MPKERSQHTPRICEKNFIESDFVWSHLFATSLRYQKTLKSQLKPKAISTVISEPKKTVKPKTKLPKKSEALEKRQQIKVCISYSL